MVVCVCDVVCLNVDMNALRKIVSSVNVQLLYILLVSSHIELRECNRSRLDQANACERAREINSKPTGAGRSIAASFRVGYLLFPSGERFRIET